MQTSKQQPQHHMHKTGEEATTSFNKRKYMEYQTLTKVRATGLYIGKAPEAHEMMEDFYLRMLPVTYRDWMHSQLKDNSVSF